MWAKSKRKSGFTIVELLIVIVVIGILAAITIIAYNGIQTRAINASLNSDLEGAAKQLGIDYVTNSTYPITSALANNGLGLRTSSGNSFPNFTVNNSTSPPSYCLTETNSTTNASNYVTSTNNVPTTGSCAITNLVANPGFETNTTGWQGYGNAPNLTRSTLYAKNGSASMGLAPSTNGWNGGQFYASSLVPGTTLTFSVSTLRQSGGGAADIVFEWRDASSVYISQTGSVGLPVISGTWQRTSTTATVPAGAVNVYLIVRYTGGIANTDVLYIDNVMLTTSSPLYNYADGTSPGWSWNGTVNNSTSTGPPL